MISTSMLNLPALSVSDVFLIWLSLLSLTLFVLATHSLKRLNKKLSETKQEESTRWQDLELKAQKEYQEIIENANKKAGEIMLSATQLKHETSVNLQVTADDMLAQQAQALKQITIAVAKKHEEQLKALNDDNIKVLSNIYKELQQSAKNDFANYKKIVQDQTFQAEKIAQDRINSEYLVFEKELNEIKKQRLTDLNEKIYRVIQKVSKDVLGKSLTITDQENLILKSLDNAKKENLL
jgi:SHS2 domain-containing protein